MIPHLLPKQETGPEISTKAYLNTSIWMCNSCTGFLYSKHRSASTAPWSHSEFLQASPFYNAWRVDCGKYFTMWNTMAISCLSWELQGFSEIFAPDIFLFLLRHLMSCRKWSSVFPTLHLTAVGFRDSFHDSVWRRGGQLEIIYAGVLNICIVMRF